MALIDINKNPSKRELVWFGVMLAAFVVIVGLLAGFKFDAPSAGLWIWVVGGVLAMLYFAIPPLRRGVYLGWLYAAFPIGWTVSHVLLGIIYFLVITPVGLLMRVVGYDPMSRKLDRSAATYWSEHRPCDVPSSRYFRQF